LWSYSEQEYAYHTLSNANDTQHEDYSQSLVSINLYDFLLSHHFAYRITTIFKFLQIKQSINWHFYIFIIHSLSIIYWLWFMDITMMCHSFDLWRKYVLEMKNVWLIFKCYLTSKNQPRKKKRKKYKYI